MSLVETEEKDQGIGSIKMIIDTCLNPWLTKHLFGNIEKTAISNYLVVLVLLLDLISSFLEVTAVTRSSSRKSHYDSLGGSP